LLGEIAQIFVLKDFTKNQLFDTIDIGGNMKRIHLIAVLYFMMFSIHFLFSENNIKEYIVLSNNVNIRDNPNYNSNIIRKISFPEILTIYEIIGTGKFINGVLDKWARISDTKFEWINYYYIFSFPFVVSANDGYNFDSDDYNTLIISSYFRWKEHGKLFFMARRNFSSFNYNNMEYEVDAKFLIEGINIIDNPWTRLYNFCDNFREYINKIDNKLSGWRIIIENEIILDYGIHVGMNFSDIERIFGNGYEKQGNNIYHYQAIYIGYGSEIYFYTEENTVTKIEYLIIK
jgi:hypothetical protein